MMDCVFHELGDTFWLSTFLLGLRVACVGIFLFRPRDNGLYCEFHALDYTFFALDMIAWTGCSMNWTVRFRARHSGLESESASCTTLSANFISRISGPYFFIVWRACWEKGLSQDFLCTLDLFSRRQRWAYRAVNIFSAWYYIPNVRTVCILYNTSMQNFLLFGERMVHATGLSCRFCYNSFDTCYSIVVLFLWSCWFTVLVVVMLKYFHNLDRTAPTF